MADAAHWTRPAVPRLGREGVGSRRRRCRDPGITQVESVGRAFGCGEIHRHDPRSGAGDRKNRSGGGAGSGRDRDVAGTGRIGGLRSAPLRRHGHRPLRTRVEIAAVAVSKGKRKGIACAADRNQRRRNPKGAIAIPRRWRRLRRGGKRQRRQRNSPPRRLRRKPKIMDQATLHEITRNRKKERFCQLLRG